MDYVLRPSLTPTPKHQRAHIAVLLTVLVCLLILVGQHRPASTHTPQQPTVAQPTDPAFAIHHTEPMAIDPNPVQIEPKALAEPSLTDRAIEFIEPFEGRHSRAYRDSLGNLTIGVGFNLDRDGAAEDLNKLLPGVGYRALRRGDQSLTDAQIDVLLYHDAQRAIDTARRQVTGFDTLPVEAQLIVIDMTFNTGSLHKWRKLRSALAQQDYAAAADAMHRSLWRRQTGQRAEQLIELMESLADR